MGQGGLRYVQSLGGSDETLMIRHGHEGSKML
jgi:hypothetical protein